jgi:hypothetical protein
MLTPYKNAQIKVVGGTTQAQYAAPLTKYPAARHVFRINTSVARAVHVRVAALMVDVIQKQALLSIPCAPITAMAQHSVSLVKKLIGQG